MGQSLPVDDPQILCYVDTEDKMSTVVEDEPWAEPYFVGHSLDVEDPRILCYAHKPHQVVDSCEITRSRPKIT